MKIDVEKLLLACERNMRKVIQLDDLLENLGACKLITQKEFEMLQDKFYYYIEYYYGSDFLNNFIDICNSANYIENL